MVLLRYQRIPRLMRIGYAPSYSGERNYVQLGVSAGVLLEPRLPCVKDEARIAFGKIIKGAVM